MSKLTPKEIRMITAQLKEKAEPEIKRELILTGISSQFDIDKIINNISKYIK